jgi:hypothetical protein
MLLHKAFFLMTLSVFFSLTCSTAQAEFTKDDSEDQDYIQLSSTPITQYSPSNGQHNFNTELSFIGLQTLNKRSRESDIGNTRFVWWLLRDETISGLSTNAFSEKAGLWWTLT